MRFCRGGDLYDFARMGFVSTLSAQGDGCPTGYLMDTTVIGHGNGGHRYGTELPADDKRGAGGVHEGAVVEGRAARPARGPSSTGCGQGNTVAGPRVRRHTMVRGTSVPRAAAPAALAQQRWFHEPDAHLPGPARPAAAGRGWPRRRQHPEPERVVDDRPRRHHHQVPRGGLRRLDLRRLQRFHHQRREVTRRPPSTPNTWPRCGTPTSRACAARSPAPIASDVYNNKIVAERSWMQSTNTRVVTFELCGNDGLQARSALQGPDRHLQLRRARHRRWPTARPSSLVRWTTSTPMPIPGVKLKVIANLYYPGYNGRQRAQLLHVTRAPAPRVNMQRQVPACAWRSMNYWMCEYARTRRASSAWTTSPFTWARTTIRNGDGQVDSAALRYVAGETEAAYVTRITLDPARHAARCEHALRVLVDQQLRLHAVGRRASDLHRAAPCPRGPVRRHHRHRRGALHLVHQRPQEPDLEPATATSAWAMAAVGVQPGQHR